MKTVSLALDSTVSDPAVAQPVSTSEDALDSNGSDDAQTYSARAPLQRSDTMDTVRVDNDDEDHIPFTSTQPAEDSNLDPSEATQIVEQPPSPSASTATLHPHIPENARESASEAPIVKAEPSSVAIPSANRLSISYAAATRRLVIDAGVVEKLKVFRQEARIEVHMNINKNDFGKFRGILVSVINCNHE